jgi:glycogen debranching enzyme
VHYGLADEDFAQRIADTLLAAHCDQPWPVRVVLHPLSTQHEQWRPYMARHQQNLPHQYHNGGIWPFVGGYFVMVLAQLGRKQAAREALARLAAVNALDDWRFTEWLHGRTAAPMGMAGQSWNAATFLMAKAAVARLG